MAFQVSPGVNVSEIDATNVVPAVSTSDAGFAAAFVWGPADKITTIASEVALVDTFGKPDSDTQTNWYTAASFLAYAGALQVVRTLGSTALNALDGASVSGEGAVSTLNQGVVDELGTIVAGDGYATATGLATTVAPAGGSGATVDIVADAGGQITSVTVNAGGQTYKSGDILTIVQGGGNGGTVEVGGVANAITLGTTTFTPSATWNGGSDQTGASSGATTVSPAGGTGATFTVTTTSSGTSVTVVTISAAGSGYNSGDVITIEDPGSTDETIKVVVETVTSTGGVLVANEDDFDANSTSGQKSTIAGTASFVARYSGTLGNAIQVGLFHQTGTLAGWDGNFVQNGATKTIEFGDLFDRAPNTSSHVLSKNGGTDVNDEVHIVVVDRTGAISGTAGTVIEKFAHVSLCSDAKNDQGNSNWIKDVIRRDSRYIYATGQWDNIQSQWEDKTSSGTTPFTDAGAQSINLSGGTDVNSSSASGGGNTAARRYVADKGYYLFRDVDSVDVGLLITGEDDTSGTLTADLIDNVAEYRKDAVVFYSIDRTKSVNNSAQSTKGDNLKTYITSTINKNSSYAVMDSGWKRTYNRYTDTYVDVPLNGDIAGLCVATDQSRDAWWSPAGFSRGQIRNVVKLWYNPDKAERDKIYKVGVNPVVAMPGAGTILYGDKTSLQKPSAFDRINVRRLFIVLEKAISRAAKFMLFEFNDEFTRSTFRNMVEPFLGEIKTRRGIYDYKVVCDTSNNTGEVIDRNEFVGDIYIKPARSINFIQLNFVAVRTGVDFSEVAG